MIMVRRPSRAEPSDLVQPSPNALETFFIAPARNFFVMSYAAQAATFEPDSLPTPPSFPVLRSAQVIMLFIECRT